MYLHDMLLCGEVFFGEKAREVRVLHKVIVCLQGRVEVDGAHQLSVQPLLQVQQNVAEDVLLQRAQQEQNPRAQNAKTVANVLVVRGQNLACCRRKK
jgi:hypothetical protein